jgi:hypothetical protein
VWKDDLNASSAELVYGSPLQLPGEFFVPSPAECTDFTEFASWLRVHIAKLRPILASRHATPSTFIFTDLVTASHRSSSVFLRQGALQGVQKYLKQYSLTHLLCLHFNETTDFELFTSTKQYTCKITLSIYRNLIKSSIKLYFPGTEK